LPGGEGRSIMSSIRLRGIEMFRPAVALILVVQHRIGAGVEEEVN
jgi:hypothetical protein